MEATDHAGLGRNPEELGLNLIIGKEFNLWLIRQLRRQEAVRGSIVAKIIFRRPWLL